MYAPRILTVNSRVWAHLGRFVGLQVVLWGFSWAVSHNPRVAFAREVDVGAVVVFDVARGGPVLVGFEARCAWSGRRSQRGAR
jgi:hypothetical protein